LSALFGKTRTVITDTSTDTELIDQANQLYEKVLSSMQDGNWSGIGKNLDELGLILERLK